MKNFIYQNPTKLIYGEDELPAVISEIAAIGPKTLLVIGGNSFKQHGNYDTLVQKLHEKNIVTFTLDGITAPLLSKVEEGIQICKENNINSVIGIGGGSSMDVAKAIALGTKQNEPIWDFLDMKLSEEGRTHLPVITIVTYPSSGSEMDSSAQIDHDTTLEKRGLNSIAPTLTWLNPSYMKTIPDSLLKYGQMTVFAQITSTFLSLEESNFAEEISTAFLKTIINNLKIALDNPDDIDARKNLMLASSLSCSGITSLGKNGDWSLIPLVGMAQTTMNVSYSKAMTILLPYWVESIYSNHPIFKKYFVDIFDIDTTNLPDELILEKGLEKMRQLYQELGIALTFKELNPTLNSDIIPSIVKFSRNQGEFPSQFGTFTPERVEEIMFEAVGLDK